MIQDIFRMYDEINIGTNPTCLSCIAAQCANHSHRTLTKPLSIWQVGDKFRDDKHKILFVGKTAVEDVGQDTGKGYFDTTRDAAGLYQRNYSPYWTYTKAILESLGY